MRKVATLGLTILLAASAAPSFAQFQKPEDAIKYRQSTMFIQAQHFGRIGAMVNGRVPFDANVATANAEVVATMSRLHWAGFMAGSEGGKSKPEIWKEAAKFKEYGDGLQAETGKMLAAAKSGNLDSLKASFTATAGSCKTCHDAYRP